MRTVPHCSTHGWLRRSASRLVCRNLGMYIDSDLLMQRLYTGLYQAVRHDVANMQNPTVNYQTSTAVTCSVPVLAMAGLQQCDTGQPSMNTTGEIAVCFQCCDTSNVPLEEI